MSDSAEVAVPIVIDYSGTHQGPRSGRTIFIDRDGVINVNRPDHVKTWDEFEFLPGALGGLSLLASHDYRVIVLTNQAAVNRGLITRTELVRMHDAMARTVAAHGGRVEAVLVCPHRPDEGCACRKPAPGLLLHAQRRFAVRLADALLIGDHPDDMEAARRAGCRSLLVLSGRTQELGAVALPPSCIAVMPDLVAAAQHILSQAASCQQIPAQD